MNRIHVLDDSTINKIAAGEVVERPASVIKELVENALDAGASKIEVEIAAGGTSYMRVTDDGRGMNREDAAHSVLRHATSKIQNAEDLSRLVTLGFRGEALATIAAVSKFSLRTREEGTTLGTEVKVLGGAFPEVHEVGTAMGTTVEVRDLFFNTPARKKFLKTTHTEQNKISEYLAKLALSRPTVAFRFLSNGKLSLATPGGDEMRDTIASIYGAQTSKALLPLVFEDEDLRLHGYISKPSLLKSNRSWQAFIVNGRVVANKVIAKAMENAYQTLVPKTGFPLAVLHFEVPPNTIDVNVHPQKIELKFEDEGRIFRATYKAVVDALRPQGQTLSDVAAEIQTPKNHAFPEAETPKITGKGKTSTAKISAHGSASTSYAQPLSLDLEKAQNMMHEERRHYQVTSVPVQDAEISNIYAKEKSTTEDIADIFESKKETPQDASRKTISPDETLLSPIGQVAHSYIIAEGSDGLYIIDQHAAHERVLYDRFSKAAGKIPVQRLLVHALLEFDEREATLVTEHLTTFRDLGLALEPIAPRTFRLLETPADLPPSEAENVIREILMELQARHVMKPEEIRHTFLASAACHAAIRFGDVLNLRQMQILVEELAQTARPYTCPHGRPTILKFTQEELARMFHRT